MSIKWHLIITFSIVAFLWLQLINVAFIGWYDSKIYVGTLFAVPFVCLVGIALAGMGIIDNDGLEDKIRMYFKLAMVLIVVFIPACFVTIVPSGPIH